MGSPPLLDKAGRVLALTWTSVTQVHLSLRER